ncbi:MAG: hypothetical protein R3284_12620, partial [Rubricoccaceae bacterium]|nr:hypothetical protein [Rubricoccaceae bacterium]
ALILRFLFFVMYRDRTMTHLGAPPDAPRSLYVSLGLFWFALIVSVVNLTGWLSPPSLDLHLVALLILFAPGIQTMVYSFVATADSAIDALRRNHA